MSEFRGTKGEWIYDTIKNGIVNKNVKGLLATAWCTYSADIHEDRFENESWLSMRERTKSIRDNCEIEQKANAKLIACAPEMFEMLKNMKDYLGSDNRYAVEQLIKKATEI